MARAREVSVLGAKETVRILKQFEPDFAKEFERELREIGNVVADRARGMTPASALSGWTTWRGGWNQGSVRAGIGVRTFPRRKFGTTEQSIVSITSMNAAGAIYERAGIRNKITGPQGASFIANLNNKHGGGLRLVGRAVNQSIGQTQQKIEEVTRRAAGDLQSSLDQSGVSRI